MARGELGWAENGGEEDLLADMAHDFLDGNLTEAETVAYLRLLFQDPAARRIFLEVAALRRVLRGRSAERLN